MDFLTRWWTSPAPVLEKGSAQEVVHVTNVGDEILDIDVHLDYMNQSELSNPSPLTDRLIRPWNLRDSIEDLYPDGEDFSFVEVEDENTSNDDSEFQEQESAKPAQETASTASSVGEKALGWGGYFAQGLGSAADGFMLGLCKAGDLVLTGGKIVAAGATDAAKTVAVTQLIRNEIAIVEGTDFLDSETRKNLAEIALEGKLLEISKQACDLIWRQFGKKFIEEKAGNFPDYKNNKEDVDHFLRSYATKLLEKVFAVLALPATSQEQLLPNAVKKLAGILDEHTTAKGDLIPLSQELREGLFTYNSMPQSTEDEQLSKAEKYQKLQILAQPIVKDILSIVGLNGLNDLHLDYKIRAGLWYMGIDVWRLLNEEILPSVVFELIRLSEAHPNMTLEKECAAKKLSGYSELEEIVFVGVNNTLPNLFDSLSKQSGSIAAIAMDSLQDIGIDSVPHSWVESLILKFCDSDDPALRQFHSLLGFIFADCTFSGLQSAAVSNDDSGKELEERAHPSNIGKLAAANLLKIVHQHLTGREDAIFAAIAEHDRLQRSFQVLRSAKRLLTPENVNFLKMALELSEEDSSNKKQSVEQCLDATIAEFFKAAGFSAKDISAIIADLRGLKNSKKSDAELLRDFFFGSLEDDVIQGRNLDQSLSRVTEGIKVRQAVIGSDLERILKENFGALSIDLLKSMGFDDPKALGIPGADFLMPIIRDNFLPQVLLHLYRGIVESQKVHADYLERVGILLVDQESLDEKLRSNGLADPVLEKARKKEIKNQRRKEAEDVKNLLDDAFLIFGDDAKSVIQAYLCNPMNSKEIAKIAKKYLSKDLENLGQEGQISDAAVSFLDEVIQGLVSSDSLETKAMFDQISARISTILLKFLVRMSEKNIEKIDLPDGENRCKLLMNQLFYKIFELIDKHKQEIDFKVNEMLKDKEGKHGYTLANIFKPVCDEFLELIGFDPAVDLPELVGESVWSSIASTIFPELIGSMYLKATAWERQKQANEKKLQDLGVEHAKEAIDVMAQYIAASAPSQLAANHDSLAEMTLDVFTGYFEKLQTPSAKKITAYLQANQEAATSLIGENFAVMGANNSLVMQGAVVSAKEYVHGILLKLMVNISEKISAKDEGKSEFVEEVALMLLTLLVDHAKNMKKVNKQIAKEDAKLGTRQKAYGLASSIIYGDDVLCAKEKVFKDHPEYIAAQRLFDGLESKLKSEERLLYVNQTLARNTSANESAIKTLKGDLKEAKAALEDIRNKIYFNDLGLKFLEVAGLQDSDLTEEESLAFPDFLRKAVPSILNIGFQSLMDEAALNSMYKTILDKVNGTANIAAQPNSSLNLDAILPEKSDLDIRFDQKCGELVELVAKLFSQTGAAMAMKLNDVKDLAADVVGGAVRGSLKDLTMIKILDLALMSAVSNLVPDGEWKLPKNGLPGSEVFRPKDGTVRPLDFKLPMSQAEKHAKEAQRKVEAKKVADEINETDAKTLSAKHKEILHASLKGLWDTFQKSWDDATKDVNGGGVGWEIKQFFDKICRMIFIDVIGTCLLAIWNHTISALFWWIAENTYYAYKANEINKDLKNPANEDLLFKFGDAILDGIIEEK